MRSGVGSVDTTRWGAGLLHDPNHPKPPALAHPQSLPLSQRPAYEVHERLSQYGLRVLSLQGNTNGVLEMTDENMSHEEKLILREVLIVANNNERFFDHLSNKLDLDYEYLTEVIDKLIRGLA